MQQPETQALRGILTLAALCAASYLFACAVMQLLENTRRAEVAVIRSDLAAYQVAEVLIEARQIIADAARGGERM
jgi:hypothetical protein